MLIIALTPGLQDSRTIGIKMCGVILASLSSGGGELSFLGLTHYYGHFALAAWGSGTGGAGLVGAGAYAIATTTLNISARTSLLAFSFLPVIMLISFFIVLPQGPLRNSLPKYAEYEAIEGNEQSNPAHEPADHSEESMPHEEHEGLLATSGYSSSARSFNSASVGSLDRTWRSFKANLRRSRGLFFP